MNSKIIKKFEELISFYKMSNVNTDKFRISTYSNALNIIKTYPKKIKSGKELNDFNGIGTSVIKKIDEIIKTGDLKILSSRPKLELVKVLGIGPILARKLHNNGITSISQLRKSDYRLSKMAQIGLKYHTGLSKKLNRKQVKKIGNEIKTILNHFYPNIYRVIIAGGYMNENECMKDIDIILTPKNKIKKNRVKSFNDIIDTLFKNELLIKTISCGKSNFMGIARGIHHIDIHYVMIDNLDYHILYFTGGKDKNQQMRLMAKKKGYKLNEKGLWKGKTKINISAKKVLKFLESDNI